MVKWCISRRASSTFDQLGEKLLFHLSSAEGFVAAQVFTNWETGCEFSLMKRLRSETSLSATTFLETERLVLEIFLSISDTICKVLVASFLGVSSIKLNFSGNSIASQKRPAKRNSQTSGIKPKFFEGLVCEEMWEVSRK